MGISPRVLIPLNCPLQHLCTSGCYTMDWDDAGDQWCHARGNDVGSQFASRCCSWVRVTSPGDGLHNNCNGFVPIMDRLARRGKKLKLKQDLQSGPPTAPRLSGEIRLEEVSFQYDQNAPMVPTRISMCTSGAGQKIAIVGRQAPVRVPWGNLLLVCTCQRRALSSMMRSRYPSAELS